MLADRFWGGPVPTRVRAVLIAAAVACGVLVAPVAPAIGQDEADAEAPPPVSQLALVVPIAAPAQVGGLIAAEELAELTGPNGALTRRLDAASGRAVTIALDPMILASIRILGDTAPPSAVSWLARLDAAPNEIFPLAYADADLSGLTQAGATMPLRPIHFEIDPGLFPEPEDPDGQPTDSPGPTASPDPTETPQDETSAPEDDNSAPSSTDPTDGTQDAETEAPDSENPSPQPTAPPAPTVPTTESLTDWQWTTDSLWWPRAGTVIGSDLDTFATWGEASTTILGSRNIDTSGASPQRASGQVGDHRVLVADETLSTLLNEAATAGSDEEWAEAVGALRTALAALSAFDDAHTLLATVERHVTGARLAQTLEELSVTPTIRLVGIGQARAEQPVPVQLVDSPMDAERVNLLRLLLASEQVVAQFATVANDPAPLAGERRLSLLALASNAWEGNAGWGEAVTDWLERSSELVGSVAVAESSTLNFLQDKGNLPIAISNGLDYPITVHVSVRSQTGILVVLDSSVPVVVEANSQQRVFIPVQSIANGEATLQVSLASPTGVPISSPALVTTNVVAGWETAATFILAALLLVIFAGGIVRTVLRRRRLREESAAVNDG